MIRAVLCSRQAQHRTILLAAAEEDKRTMQNPCKYTVSSFKDARDASRWQWETYIRAPTDICADAYDGIGTFPGAYVGRERAQAIDTLPGAQTVPQVRKQSKTARR